MLKEANKPFPVYISLQVVCSNVGFLGYEFPDVVLLSRKIKGQYTFVFLVFVNFMTLKTNGFILPMEI